MLKMAKTLRVENVFFMKPHNLLAKLGLYYMIPKLSSNLLNQTLNLSLILFYAQIIWPKKRLFQYEGYLINSVIFCNIPQN
jgi:hypothetical protein